ncbi:unnamed protein product [Aphanomyces euteiches]|nr:hypothetical protein AeRB84_014402 [Aphanomyces euteiches]
MAKPTVAAANDLYERVISSFEASQGEPNVPDALKDKPKEFFSQIAAKWRNQLEQYKLPHDESIEIAPEQPEPLAVEDEEKSDDAADIKQHRPGFDLNAIGRPAPFMEDPHKSRQRVEVAHRAPARNASKQKRQATLADKALCHPGTLVGVYSQTKLTARTMKRNYSIGACLLRTYESASCHLPRVVYIQEQEAEGNLIRATTEPVDASDMCTVVVNEEPRSVPRDQVYYAVEHLLVDGIAYLSMDAPSS